MTEVSIVLEKPAAALSPNSVCGTTPNGVWTNHLIHIGAKKRARKVASREAGKAAVPEHWVPQEYTLIWYYWGTKRDADNCLASCKAYLDGCADAWRANDRDWECARILRVRDKARAGLVELRFRDELTQYESNFALEG